MRPAKIFSSRSIKSLLAARICRDGLRLGALQNLIQAYREVVASAWSPRAIFYRVRKGYSEQYVVHGPLKRARLMGDQALK